jgi:Putative pectate lyase-like adhesive domain
MSKTATHMKMFTPRARRLVAALGSIGLAAGGLVTWMSAPAAATTVTDEATFRSAWTNAAETQIDLTNDINLTCGGGGVAIRNSTTALTLDGHGHTVRQTCATNGALQQAGAGALTLQNVTITGGDNTVPGYGGGLFSHGPATFSNSVVSGNTSSNGGGGLWVEAALTITDSTVSGNHNTGTFGGGGISAAGPTTITTSTISGNDAGLSGGIGGGGMAVAGATSITNSTITGNSAGGFGGGGIAISISGTTTLVYSTVVGNSAPPPANGANVQGSASQSHLVSFGSVVALPQGSGINCAGLGGGTTSNGYNFSDDASCGFTAATDQQNAGNPNLGTLVNNGGPTQTRRPQSGSPLINAVPTGSCQADGAAGVTTDQRGIHRPQGSGCDIGAVEVEQVPQSKEDCKNGGWQNFVDSQGHAFRNQGDCVSFAGP